MTGDPTAVLRRELSRVARQRTTTVVRVVFVGALLLVFLLQMRTFGDDPRTVAEQAVEARELFLVSCGFALVAVGLAAPALLSTAFVEEREQATLDLLRLTRLRPWAVVLGGLGARGVGVVGLVVALLPAMSMLLPFGGIAVQEMFGLVCRALLVGALLGLVGGYVSLSARSVVGPFVAAMGFAFFGLWVLPAIVVEFGLRSGELIPYAAPMLPSDYAETWAWNLALWTPAGLAALAMTVARYRHQLLGRKHAEDPAGRAEQRRWEAWGTAVSAAMLGCVIVTVGLACLGHVADVQGWWPTSIWLPLLVWGMTPVVFTAFTLWYLQVAGALVERFGEGESVARFTGLHLPRAALLPWVETSFLVRNPVVVRELRTRALGGLGLVAALALGAWGSFGLLLFLVDGFELEVRVISALGAGGLALLQAFSLAAITLSVVDERRAGTLPLLMTTSFAPWRVVVGKLVALGVRFGWIGVAIALFGALRLADAPPEVPGWQLAIQGALEVAATGAWLGSTAAVALGVALVVRPAYLGWGVNLGWPVGWLILSFAAQQQGSDVGSAVAMPYLVEGVGQAKELAVAVAVHGFLTAVAIVGASVLLRRVAAREVGP